MTRQVIKDPWSVILLILNIVKPANTMHALKICLLGLENIPVLVPGYERFRVGGEQVQQSLLALALAQRGFQVSTVCMDFGQCDGLEYENVRVYKSYKEGAGLPILRFIYPRWITIWNALKRADADIYYTSCAGMQVGLLALFCKFYGRKFIFRIAHDSDCDPKNLLIGFARDRWLYNYGIRHAAGILAQSQQQSEMLKQNYGISSNIAGMLVERPKRIVPQHERDIEVLWVNNIRQFKRPDLVLDLALRMPDISFHVIGGPNDPELYAQIEQRSASIKNLTFHGAVPYRLVGEFYGRARLFVNTSDTEGFPNSYLQSWIRGTPVVAFFDPDAVIQREGLGIAVSNMDEMEASIRRLLNDSADLETAGRNCSEFMERIYGEDIILAPYIDMIADITKG